MKQVIGATIFTHWSDQELQEKIFRSRVEWAHWHIISCPSTQVVSSFGEPLKAMHGFCFSVLTDVCAFAAGVNIYEHTHILTNVNIRTYIQWVQCRRSMKVYFSIQCESTRTNTHTHKLHLEVGACQACQCRAKVKLKGQSVSCMRSARAGIQIINLKFKFDRKNGLFSHV